MYRDRDGRAFSLAVALREQTREQHARAERAGVMGELLGRRIPRRTYCALLRNLLPIYAALESALATPAARPKLAPIAFPELRRADALENDLRVLRDGASAPELPLVTAARDYALRLPRIGMQRPTDLIAHAYLRYLGDLSGGQILRAIVADLFALPDRRGTRFYDFGSPEEASDLARRFRAGLDAIELDAEQAACVIAEAKWGFEMHGRLFEELRQACR